jgi:ABC-type transport system substrate-binding protein
MRIRSPIIIALSLCWCVVVVLLAEVSHAAPAKRIYAGVYLHDVAKFDQKDGVFDVDMELWAKWLGDFDAAKLTIANASEVDRQLVAEESDGAWKVARWRVRGTLRGEFPLQRFPFDQQTLSVVLELPERDGEIVPDLAGSGMHDHFSVTGWLYDAAFVPRVSKDTYRSDLGSIATEGRPTTVGRAAFEVTLRRPLLTASTKLFLPLLVILLVALVALFIHPKELEVRASVGVTSLLACFAFHFAVADSMPSVSYITLADVLFLVSYALTAALLVVSVIAYWLDTKGRERAWRRLDFWSLIAFPIVLVVAVVASVAPGAARAAGPPAVARESRPASSKSVVRIGTNTLGTPGTFAARAAYWGTYRTELDGSRVPVLVDEVPSITNDSLRFLADGKLEVTWRLKANLKWSDGAPLTADDLVFALQVSPDPRIVETRVVSPRELLVRFADRITAATDSITPLPRHALQAEFKSGGYEAVRAYRRTRPTPSSGPYRIAEFAVDDRLLLEVNPYFCGAPPSIQRIEIRRLAKDEELVKAFESGSIDMIAPNAISPAAASALAARRPDSVKLRPSDVLVSLHLDPSHPLLSRGEVRRALAIALDRERIMKDVFGEAASFARVSHVPVPGPLPEGAVAAAYDAAAARKILESERANETSLPLIHGPAAIDKAIASGIARDLGAAGLKVELKEVASTTDVYRKRKHGGLLLYSTTGDRDAPPERYWSLPQVDGKFDRAFRSNAFDDSVVQLIEREERALYPERREQIRDLLFASWSQRLPHIPLFFLVDRLVAVAGLEGWQEGSGNRFGLTIERWHFAASVPRPAE